MVHLRRLSPASLSLPCSPRGRPCPSRPVEEKQAYRPRGGLPPREAQGHRVSGSEHEAVANANIPDSNRIHPSSLIPPPSPWRGLAVGVALLPLLTYFGHRSFIIAQSAVWTAENLLRGPV